MAQTGEQAHGRINVRIAPDQEARIRAAAEANGESLTGFVLAAANERAEVVLDRAGRIALQSAAYKRFVEALNEPVAPMATLRRYAEGSSPIPGP
jgi:uncharacterized protein (DUF1778 family)